VTIDSDICVSDERWPVAVNEVERL